MACEVRRRPRAENDLIDIWSYIADDNFNESAADRLLDKFEGILTMLSSNPQAGRARTELKADLRSFPVGNYVIFYRLMADGIEVIRVLSGYLDVQPSDLQ